MSSSEPSSDPAPAPSAGGSTEPSGSPPTLGLAVFRGLLWGLLLAAVTIGGSLLLTRGEGRRPEPPRLGRLPSFELIDQRGRTVRLDDLAGEPWIADFVFTRCAGPCPLMSRRMQALGDRLPVGVRRVSITVDPDFDTPEVLAGYAARYGAGEGGDWLFLTGDRAAIWSLSLDGFKLAVADADAETFGDHGPILHSTRFVLVDGDGTIRGYYDAFDPEHVGRLVGDAKVLARRS